MHRRGASWVNPQAEQTFNTLEEQRQTQTTQSTASSSGPAVDEHGVMEQVLGMRRGYKIGVGSTLPQKHYSGVSPSSAGSFSDATSSAQPDPHVQRCLDKSYREQLKIYENQVKMIELYAQLQPNAPLHTIHRPEPVHLDDLPSSSDNDSPNDDPAADDAANLDD